MPMETKLPQGLYTRFIVLLFALLPIFAVILQGRWVLLFCGLPGLMILVFGFTLLRSSQQTFPASRYSILLAIFFLWFALVGLWSPMPETHYYLFSYLLVWPIVFWLYLLLPECDRYWSILFTSFCLIALAFGAVTIYRYLVWQHFPNAYHAWFGEFKNKNMLAALCNMTLLPLLGYCMAKPQKIITWLGFILLSLLLAFLGSRGAILAFIAGVLFIHMSLYRFANWKVWLVVWVYAILLVTYSTFFSIDAHTSSGVLSLLHPQHAGSSRFLIWHVAWVLIKQHPWVGTGLGSFFWLSMHYRSPLDHSTGLFVHNNYLQTWLAGGLPALLILLAMLAVLAWMYWQFVCKHKVNDAKKAEVVGLFAAMLSVCVHGLFSYTLFALVIISLFAVYSARLHCLLASELSLKTWRFDAKNYIRPVFYYLFIAIAMFAAFVYYGSASVTLLYARAGDAAFAKNNWAQAQKYYQTAALFQPNRMELLISQARLNVLLDKKIPPNASFAKFVIDTRLQRQLAILQQKYSYVAYPYLLQVQYYTHNKSGYCKIKIAYQKARYLIPLSKDVKQKYQQFLSQKGNKVC